MAVNTVDETLNTRVRRLLENLVALLRARLEQAQQEGRALVRDVITGVLLILAALLLLVLVLPIAVVTVILALAEVLPAWAATGLVLLAMVLAAAGLFLTARARFRRRRLQFWRGLREDAQMVRRLLEGKE